MLSERALPACDTSSYASAGLIPHGAGSLLHERGDANAPCTLPASCTSLRGSSADLKNGLSLRISLVCITTIA